MKIAAWMETFPALSETYILWHMAELLRDGVDVLVADDAAGFAAAIVRLYGDATLWMELSINGHANIARHFSADAARGALRRIFFEGRGAGG